MSESPLARSSRTRSLCIGVLCALALCIAAPSSAPGQDGGGGEPVGGTPPVDPPPEPTEEEKARAAAEAEAARALAERREKIARMFHASEAKYDDEGRLVLRYDFGSGDEALAGDWGPDIESFKKRVRWSRGWEGGTGNRWRDTIVVSESGLWLHKAQWRDVVVDVQFQLLTEIFKPGDLVAAVFAYDKNRKLAGCNIGEQCIRLDAGLKHATAPIPPLNPLLQAGEERTFGYTLKDGKLAATQSGHAKADTSSNEKFLPKLGPGHVGVAWRGEYMKGYLISVTIRGTLDEEWVGKALGD